MAIRYTITQKVNPFHLLAPPKYYMVQKTLGSISRKELINEMARLSHLTTHQAAAGMDALFEVVTQFVTMGHSVKLGELGYFKTTIKSVGADTPEGVLAQKSKSQTRLRFVVGKQIRNEINKITLEKYVDYKKQELKPLNTTDTEQKQQPKI